LIDGSLAERLDIQDSFLDREEWSLIKVDGGWLERIQEHRPDLVVLQHRREDPEVLDVIRTLRADQTGLSQLRVLCLLDESTYTAQYDNLSGSSIACLVGGVDSETVIAAITQLLNVPTRVNVRVKVVFEMQGRDQRDELFHGRMLDVSTGGFCFESEEQLEEGSTLYCFFSLGRDEPVIFTSGRIVRISKATGDACCYGVEFRDVRIEDRRRIADFVYRHCSDDVPFQLDGSSVAAFSP
jgi:hypothetical protein